MKLIAQGDKIVSMVEFKGMVIVATENGVYELKEDANGVSLKPIEFINE